MNWLRLAVSVVMASAPLCAGAASADELALGQRIYREGIGAEGRPLMSLAAADTPLAGKPVACEKCHRRSGFGGTEGQLTIRPITALALTGQQEIGLHAPRVRARVGTRTRPPYTEALIARAIATGVDAAGEALDPLMPRYRLDAREMKAITAYLLTLSAQPSPGVDDRDIHFATVIQPGVSAEKRRAMLDVMHAFVKDKDANARHDEARRDAGNMRMYRAYRKWVLHEWELTGPRDTWGAQLDALYAKQPVFALVGGLGHESWQPIHEFSERQGVPTVFPQADLPMLSGPNQYTIYFSRGVTLEAQVLATYIRDQPEAGPLVQVYRRDGPGAVAAAAFHAALKPETPIQDIALGGPVDAALWKAVAAAKPGAVVLWLGANDVEQASLPGDTPVYLSHQLLNGKRPEMLTNRVANLRLIDPGDLPPRREARLLRSKLWLHNKGIAPGDEAVQINTEFAMTVVSDVIGHMADSFSRDFFVERVEHVVAQTPMPSTFAQVSLGPGQRFAAKGASIVQLVPGDKPGMKALSAWIVP